MRTIPEIIAERKALDEATRKRDRIAMRIAATAWILLFVMPVSALAHDSGHSSFKDYSKRSSFGHSRGSGESYVPPYDPSKPIDKRAYGLELRGVVIKRLPSIQACVQAELPYWTQRVSLCVPIAN